MRRRRTTNAPREIPAGLNASMSLFHLERNPSLRQLRQFGVIGAMLLFILGWWLWPRTPLVLAMGVLGTILLGCAVGRPRLLRHPFVGLSAILYPLGAVVGEFALAITYFLVVTPIAAAFRLLRRDALQRTLDSSRTSYWEEAHQPQDPASYFRQY